MVVNELIKVKGISAERIKQALKTRIAFRIIEQRDRLSIELGENIQNTTAILKEEYFWGCAAKTVWSL